MPLLSLRNADGCRTAILDADVENVADEDDVKTHFAGEQIDVLGTRSIPSFGSVIGTRNGLFQKICRPRLAIRSKNIIRGKKRRTISENSPKHQKETKRTQDPHFHQKYLLHKDSKETEKQKKTPCRNMVS